jgi:hypothetical protein
MQFSASHRHDHDQSPHFGNANVYDIGPHVFFDPHLDDVPHLDDPDGDESDDLDDSFRR